MDAEARPASSPQGEVWRGHLARELHDQVAQPLVSLLIELHEFASSSDPRNPSAAVLKRLEDTVRAILRNTREMLVDLRGQGEIRLNFREVLKNELIRTSADRGSTAPSLQISSSWPEQINGWAAFNMLRIVQEAVANAVRHGRARRVDIILSTSTGTSEEAVVVVVDDGVGIGDAPSGIGMLGMSERAVILGGTLSMAPRLGGGTRIEARIPLQRLQ